MSKQNYKVQHKKSSVLGKQPTSDKLEYGELGINYNKDSVGVYLKNSDNKIVQVGGDMSSFAKSSDLDTKQDKLNGFYQDGNVTELKPNDDFPNHGMLIVATMGAELNFSDDGKVQHNIRISNDGAFYDNNEIATTDQVEAKQDKLVSGTNIKTINGETLLGEGNVVIQGGGDGKVKDVQVNGTSILNQTTGIANITSIPTPQNTWNSYTTGNYIYSNTWVSDGNNDKVVPTIKSALEQHNGNLKMRWWLWGDNGDGKVWGNVVPTASTVSDGAMSKEDKIKLDGINLSNYYTKTQADNQFAAKGDVPSSVYTKDDIDNLLNDKQDKLISGVTLKTINNQSLLGEGNIDVSGGGGGGLVDDVRIGETSLVNDRVAVITEATTSAAGVMSASDKTKLDGIDLSLYYTKTETDAKYAGKDDVPSTVYNKTEVNNLLNFKANSADVYTKSEADEKFATKGSGGDGKVKDVQVDGATVLDETTGIASIDLTSKANVDLSNISDTGNTKIVNIVKENSLKLLDGHEETNAFLSIDANNKLKLEGIYDIERVVSEAFNKVKESVGLTDKLEYDAGATFSIASGNNVSESLRSVDNELIQINNVKKLTLVKLVYNGTDIKDKNDAAAVYSGTQYYNKLIDLLNDTSKLVTLEITVAGSEETWLMPSIESSGRVVFSGKFKDVYENTDGTVTMEDSQFINRLKTIFQEK